MAKAWLPGAERIDGGPTTGTAARTPLGIGAPRAVWTVTCSSARVWSARAQAQRLVEEGQAVHLVWNPLCGEVAQLLAATRRSQQRLGVTHHHGQDIDHGQEGRVCVVVAVIAQRESPFTDEPMLGLPAIMAWLDSWGVVRRWPAGPPTGPPGPSAGEVTSVARVWSRGGHFGHDQVPGSTSAGPGALDTEQLLTTPSFTLPWDAGNHPSPHRYDPQKSGEHARQGPTSARLDELEESGSTG